MKVEVKFFCRDCGARNLRVYTDKNPFGIQIHTCTNCNCASEVHKVTSIIEIKPENANYVLSQEAQDELDHLEELFKSTQADTLRHMSEYVEKNHPDSLDKLDPSKVNDVKFEVLLRDSCPCPTTNGGIKYECFRTAKDFVEPMCPSGEHSVSTQPEDIIKMDFKPIYGCLACHKTLYEQKEGEILLCEECNQTYQKVNQIFNQAAASVGQHIPPLEGQILRRVAVLNGADYGDPVVSREIVAEVKNANIITSEVAGTHDHKPVLDIDLGCKLIPSTNAGHYHLYIDKQMTWPKYRALLAALKEGGVIEPGYFQAALARKYTGVRLPWIKKEINSDGQN